jgi:hypothetical protein
VYYHSSFSSNQFLLIQASFFHIRGSSLIQITRGIGLNKVQRLSIALGRPETASPAVSCIGALYLMYGTFGVVAGLFLFGICYQVYMNWFTKDVLSERRPFFYVLMLIQLMALGGDIVGSIANWIQVGLVLLGSPTLFMAGHALRHIVTPKLRMV